MLYAFGSMKMPILFMLQGYRLETEKGIVYNTFNLLRGMDGWDPMEMKAYALEMGRDRIPTLLKVEITGRVPRFEKMDGGSIGSSNSIGSNSIRSSIIGKEGVILRAKVIKFDTLSLTGYGVRVIRTAEASDGVRFVPVQYDHGKVRYLSEGVLTSCYYTGCEIMLTAEGQQMRIHGESKALGATERKCGYEAVVDMAVEVDDNPYGGIAIWHTGTPGTGGWQNTTMLHFLEVSLKETVF